MAYVIIKSFDHKNDLKSESRFYTTLEELEALKIANSQFNLYTIQYETNPNTLKALINLFGTESIINIYTSNTSNIYRTPRDELLYKFCTKYMPLILTSIKSKSYLVKIQTALLRNTLSNIKKCNSTDYNVLYNKLSRILEVIKLNKFKNKISKDIFKLISTYITYPSIGYSETGFPVIGYPTKKNLMYLPLSYKNLILGEDKKLFMSPSPHKEVHKIKILLQAYPTYQAHILSFMKLHSLNLESDVYITIL